MRVGGVYADRQLKTTRLPATVESGQVITFETELIAENKVRVTVEVSEKVITFDWNLPMASPDPASQINMGGLAGLGPMGGGLGGFGGPPAGTDKAFLFFFARLSCHTVSITVE